MLRDMGAATAWILLTFVLIAGVTLGVLGVRPLILSVERQQNVQSQQYQETEDTLIANLQQQDAQVQAEIAQLRANGGPADVIAGKQAQDQAIRQRIAVEQRKVSGR